MRILIVDDHADTKCIGIMQECDKRGIEVEVKKAINPALQRIVYGKEKVNGIICEKKEEIDGIILDMGLPIYENKWVEDANAGECVLRELKRRKKKIPVLIFSETPLKKSAYPHIFGQMKNWYVMEEAEKFNQFIEELQRREKEQQ